VVTPILSSFLIVSIITYTTPVSRYILLSIITAVISFSLSETTSAIIIIAGNSDGTNWVHGWSHWNRNNKAWIIVSVRYREWLRWVCVTCCYGEKKLETKPIMQNKEFGALYLLPSSNRHVPLRIV